MVLPLKVVLFRGPMFQLVVDSPLEGSQRLLSEVELVDERLTVHGERVSVSTDHRKPMPGQVL